MNRFRDKVAIITGASAGIGRATAEIMAREGATVLMVARDAARLEAAAQSITQAGGRAFAFAGDATTAQLAQAAVAHAVHEWGSLDILVNAVGGSTIIDNPAADIDELSHADWQKILAFNLDGLFHFCHEAAPGMKRQRSGKIVNVASISGRGLGGMTSSAYVAAKAGVIGFTKKLSIELGPWNITVNATAPSLTLSERLKPVWDKMTPEAQEKLRKQIPLRRIGTAEDQAKVVCFLGSSDSDYMTGLTLDVTGGQF